MADPTRQLMRNIPLRELIRFVGGYERTDRLNYLTERSMITGRAGLCSLFLVPWRKLVMPKCEPAHKHGRVARLLLLKFCQAAHER
jgi:hypothetical protein